VKIVMCGDHADHCNAHPQSWGHLPFNGIVGTYLVP
jgi:hypothetical protein